MMKRQKGMALIIVMVAIAIMIIAASTITVRFNRVFFVTSNTLEYQSAGWYVAGIEGIVKKYMVDSFKKNKEKINKTMVWAQPDQVIPLDDVVISGTVHDEQACININSLATNVTGTSSSSSSSSSTNTVDSVFNEATYPVLVFRRLLVDMGADDTTAQIISDSAVDWLDSDSSTKSAYGAEDQYYANLSRSHVTNQGKFYDKSELLEIRGMTPELYRRIEPMICALPNTNFKISVNMLTEKQAPLIEALFLGQLSMEDAVNVIDEQIPEYGWDSAAGFLKTSALASAADSLSGLSTRIEASVVVNSSYFVTDIKVQFDQDEFAFKTRFFRDSDTSLVVYQRLRGELNE